MTDNTPKEIQMDKTMEEVLYDCLMKSNSYQEVALAAMKEWETITNKSLHDKLQQSLNQNARDTLEIERLKGLIDQLGKDIEDFQNRI